MKAAIYISEGTTQLVLTPENEWERNCLKMLHDYEDVKRFQGGFYECRGGWIREGKDEMSTIFRLDKKRTNPEFM